MSKKREYHYYEVPPMTFRESLWMFLVQMSALAIAGIAFAVAAIAQALPWIILAGSVGVCLIIGTTTVCIIKLRQSKLPPPPQYYIEQSPSRYVELAKPEQKQLKAEKK